LAPPARSTNRPDGFGILRKLGQRVLEKAKRERPPDLLAVIPIRVTDTVPRCREDAGVGGEDKAKQQEVLHIG
jgi:hypothetical protein